MHSFFVAPANFDVVVVSGPDSVRFLQGQLTCDVAGVEEGNFCYGAACNNKGRAFAAFTLIRWQDSCYLCMTAGLGAIFLAALKKYQPFYKCSMQLSERGLSALAGDCARKALANAGMPGDSPSSISVVAAGNGWLCVLNSATPRALLFDEGAFDANQACSESTLEQWEALAMQEGHYPFRAPDSEQFTPQELHFDRNGYVSFSKGCYTGQEIVARMHYRGKQKKQLYLVAGEHTSFAGVAPVAVHDADGAEVGRSLVTRALGSNVFALVSLPSETPDGSAPKLFTREAQPLVVSPFSAQ